MSRRDKSWPVRKKSKTRWRRSLVERGMEQGFPPVYLTELALPMGVDDVLAEIPRYTDIPISKAAT